VLEDFATSFTTMFVMIDPIGLAPMFAALTAGMSRRERMTIAARGVAVSAVILVIFAIVGDGFLKMIGVSMPAFKIAGGLMLFLLSVEMLFQKRTERREKEADSADVPDPSVFPLATPLIAVYLASFAVLAICFLAFLLTEMIERVLGQTGIKVLTRLLGLLLGALAVQAFDARLRTGRLSGVDGRWPSHFSSMLQVRVG